jgi:hypothetical protein
MANTLLGNNIYTDTARMLTSGQYLNAVSAQASAANASSSNALSVAGILQQPFFGIQGGVSGLWSKYGSYVVYAGAIYALVKWILPLVGIKVLWGKRGGASSHRRSILSRARAAKRRKSL